MVQLCDHFSRPGTWFASSLLALNMSWENLHFLWESRLCCDQVFSRDGKILNNSVIGLASNNPNRQYRGNPVFIIYKFINPRYVYFTYMMSAWYCILQIFCYKLVCHFQHFCRAIFYGVSSKTIDLRNQIKMNRLGWWTLTSGYCHYTFHIHNHK